MALKIRLRKQGRTNRSFFRLVVTDARCPRDGRYLEALGWYNPIEVEEDKKISFKADRVQHWLGLGAQLTDNAACLIRRSAPHIIHELTQKKLAHRAKVATKRKEKKVQA
jgi:small subunit ribosomal protein S16